MYSENKTDRKLTLCKELSDKVVYDYTNRNCLKFLAKTLDLVKRKDLGMASAELAIISICMEKAEFITSECLQIKADTLYHIQKHDLEHT